MHSMAKIMLFLAVQTTYSAAAADQPRHLPVALVVSEAADKSQVLGLTVTLWALRPPPFDLNGVAAAVARSRPDCLQLPSSTPWRFDCMGPNYLLTYLDYEQEWFWAETQLPAQALQSHDLSWYKDSHVSIDNLVVDLALKDLYRRELENMHKHETDVFLHELFQGSFILSYAMRQGRYTVIGWQAGEQRSWLVTIQGAQP